MGNHTTKQFHGTFFHKHQCWHADVILHLLFILSYIALITLKSFPLHINVARQGLVFHFFLNICKFTNMVCAVLLYILCHLCLLFNDGNPLLKFIHDIFIRSK